MDATALPPLVVARVAKESLLRPAFRDRAATCWCLHELITLLRYLNEDFTVKRVNKNAPLLCYNVFNSGNLTLRLKIEKNFTASYIYLESNWPQLQELYRKPVPRSPPYVYGTRIIFYEVKKLGGLDMSQVLTKLGNSLIKSASGIQRLIAMQSLSPEKLIPGRVSDFHELINSLKGVVILKIAETCEVKSDLLCIQRNGKMQAVKQFGWLSASALDVIKKFSYCELDATFYCLSPYVACIPQFVYMNTSYPVGLFLGPSENFELYNMFYECFVKFNQQVPPECQVKFQFPVLSDAGRAIQKFCTERQLFRFECHRHLIQGFGTNSALAPVMLRILRSFDYNEFVEDIKLGNSVFMSLKKGQKLSKDTETKYLSLTGQVPNKDGCLVMTRTWWLDVAKWALWARGNVTTCSNHAESFHRVLNSAVRPNGRHLGMLSSFDVVVKTIKTRQDKWQESFAKNVKNEFAKQESEPKATQKQCQCQYSSKITKRFEMDVPFPCSHVSPERRQELLKQFISRGKEKLSHMVVLSHQVNVVSFVAHNDGSEGDKEEKTSPPNLHDLLPERSSKNNILNIAKDIFGILGDRIDRDEGFLWVFAWIYEAFKTNGLDMDNDTAEGYILAWDYVVEQIKDTRTK